jgi:erythromycin esterase
MTDSSSTTDGRTDDPGSSLSDSELSALDEQTIELDGSDPFEEFTDGQAVSDALAGGHIFALGEATHGTREFFRLKHRFLRYLVLEHGVRVFAMEANLPEALALNEYVVHGTGNPREALGNIYFWTWNVESILTMVEWLREFNEGRPLDDRVRFYGFDAQYTTGAVARLESYFDAVDATLPEGAREDIAFLDDDGTNPGTDNQAREHLTVADRIVPELHEHLDDYRGEYVDRQGERAFELAYRNLTVIHQASEYRHAQSEFDGDTDEELTEGEIADLEELLDIRDRAMADNVDWLLEFEDADSLALWAHDAHINREKHIVRGTDAVGVPMGKLLADRHGEEYVPVGFSFGRGSFQAISKTNEVDGEPTYELQGQTLQSPLPGTIDATLDRLDYEIALFDIQGARCDDRLETLLDEPQPHFSAGATYDSGAPEEYLTEYVYGDAFDAVCFVDDTTRARPVDGDVPE